MDKTIFYPEGKVQVSDRGRINGIALLDVQERDDEILHLVSVADGACLLVGSAELTLDVQRRRNLTVHHTGQHLYLLSGTILRLTGKSTVSMHLGDDVCTINVDTLDFSGETAVMVEETTADAIEGNYPIIIHRCPPENFNDFPLRKVPPQSEATILLAAPRDTKFAAFCSVKDRDIRGFIRDPIETWGGKGGGSSFFQRLFPSEKVLVAFEDSLSKTSLSEKLK